MATKRAQKSLAPCTDPDFDNHSEGVDNDDDWDFDGDMGGEYAQRVDVKPKLQDWQNECWTKKEKVVTNVAKAVELARKFRIFAFVGRSCRFCAVVRGFA